jgi:hypothetical protein
VRGAPPGDFFSKGGFMLAGILITLREGMEAFNLFFFGGWFFRENRKPARA